jgi:ABC-type glycerol-3-phosphate transport system substrate-binding protein
MQHSHPLPKQASNLACLVDYVRCEISNPRRECMKKTFALLAVLLIASLVLAACGGTAATPTAAPVEEPTAAPVEEPTAVPVEEPTAAPVEEPTADTSGACTGTPVKITVWHGWAGAYL